MPDNPDTLWPSIKEMSGMLPPEADIFPDNPDTAIPPANVAPADSGRSGLTRTVTFQAAWDKRNPDPAKNYGVHGIQIDFVVRGPEGAVYVALMTDWVLPEVQQWHEQLAEANPMLRQVNGRQLLDRVSIHSRIPREGWEANGKKCDFFDGPCWVTCFSYMASDPIWETMLREGDAGFWRSLEEIYRLNLTPERTDDTASQISATDTEAPE